MKKKIILFLLILCMGLIPKVTLAETYDGEYSIDYLLRNYSLVTLGNQEIIRYPYINYGDYSYNNSGTYSYNIGDFRFINSYNNYGYSNNPSNINHQIEGAVLINGDFFLDNSADNYDNTAVVNLTYGSQAGNTKSFIKGTISDNAITNSQLVTDSNYIDFNKLYQNVMFESKLLIDNSKNRINKPNVEISEPGLYTIDNMARQYYSNSNNNSNSNSNYELNSILIKNYNKNDYYIFNYYNEYIDFNSLPNINIIERGTSAAIPLYEYINSGNYSGNIIFNFPNAIQLVFGVLVSGNYGFFSGDTPMSFAGNIIAPKATVYFGANLYKENRYNIYSSIIANSILSLDYYYNEPIVLKNTKYTVNKKIVENNDDKYLRQANDYADDLYRRDYSISDLLTNYSLITLGHKAIDSKSKLLQFGNNPGSVKMFHITGQALISGDLYGKVYENGQDDYYSHQNSSSSYICQKFDRTAFDLESNEVTESYVKGKTFVPVNTTYTDFPSNYTDNNTSNYSNSVIQPWDNMSNDNIQYVYQKNNLFIGTSNNYISVSGPGINTAFVDNYINFDRLYDNVVAEQSAIDEGKEVKNGEDKVTHIPIGGNYVIKDINDINEIVFDNFDEEKDKLTIITIKNSGDINFPLISKDTGSYKGIVTNDYYGKTEATHFYEQDTFVQDSYHGNIIWNVPNATYIKLKENAPFAGHLIAPNADVDTPETHFAGCFIVNSIYGEGNTEAHFYPITVDLKCDCEGYHNLSEDMKKEFSKYRLNKLLGGEKTIIEKTIIGDQAKYEEDQVTLEKVYNQCPSNNIQNPVVELLSNPKTYRNIGIIILLLGSIISYLIYNKKKIQTQK